MIINALKWFANELLIHAWLSVLFYYAIKFVFQAIILHRLSTPRTMNYLATQIGSDLSFMGLTLFGRSIADPNSLLNNQSLLIFVLSIFFLSLFYVSFFAYRKQIQINERVSCNVRIFKLTITNPKGIRAIRYTLIGFSWCCGIIAFVVGLNLTPAIS